MEKPSKILENLTDIDLIKEIKKCDNNIIRLLTQPGLDYYPGEIMGLGDFYCEKAILIDELLRRRNDIQKT